MLSEYALFSQQEMIDDNFMQKFNEVYLHLGGMGERVLGYGTLFFLIANV